MCVFHFVKPVEAFSREGGVTISRFSGAFYPREEVGQAGVSWVALGVTRVLPSLLFRPAAQKEKGGQRLVKVLSMGGGGDCGEPYMGRTGCNRIHSEDGFFIRLDIEEHLCSL